MYCTKCGKEICGTPFCQQCGEKSPAGWLDWPREPAPASLIAPDKKSHKIRNILVLTGVVALLFGIPIGVQFVRGFLSGYNSSSSSPTASATEIEDGQRNQEAQRIASHYEGFNHYQVVGVGHQDDKLSLREKSRAHTIDSMDIKEIACSFHLDQNLFQRIVVHKLNGDDVTYNLPLQHTDGSYVECSGAEPPDLPHKSQWSFSKMANSPPPGQ